MTFASVSICICSARDLIGHDWPAVSDPYAVIELVYMTTQVMRHVAQFFCHSKEQSQNVFYFLASRSGCSFLPRIASYYSVVMCESTAT